MVKITPETYQKMEDEFREEGLAFTITIPTQDQIDDWKSQPPPHINVVHEVDMVAEMWVKHRKEQMQQILDAAKELDYSVRTVYIKDSSGKERKQIILECDYSS